jgi:hypothetical protein
MIEVMVSGSPRRQRVIRQNQGACPLMIVLVTGSPPGNQILMRNGALTALTQSAGLLVTVMMSMTVQMKNAHQMTVTEKDASSHVLLVSEILTSLLHLSSLSRTYLVTMFLLSE